MNTGSLMKMEGKKIISEFQNYQLEKPNGTIVGSSESYKENDDRLLFEGEAFSERLPQPVKHFQSILNMGEPTAFTIARHSGRRNLSIAEKLRDALFSAVAAKYVSNDGDNLSFRFSAEQLKFQIERRLHEYLPSFHTPTHLPYASMIQRAIAELGEEDGSSEESISDFMKKEYEDLPWAHAVFLRRHLQKLCDTNEIVQLKCGRYKFNTEVEDLRTKKPEGEKTTGRGRKRKGQSSNGVEYLNRKRQSHDPKTEEINGVEGDHVEGRQTKALNERKEVRKGEMAGGCREEEDKYKNEVENFGGKKQQRNLVIVGLRAQKASRVTRFEEHSSSLGEETDGVKRYRARGGRIEDLHELKEARDGEMIHELCEVEFDRRYGVEDLGKKQSPNLTIEGHHHPEEAAHTHKETEEQSGLLREEVNGAEECDDHTQGVQIEVADKIEDLVLDKMINKCCGEKKHAEVTDEPMKSLTKGSNGEEGPIEDATLEFFDTESHLFDGDENELVDALCFNKQKGNKLLEFFDAKSDPGDNEANETINAQSSIQNNLKKQLVVNVFDDRSQLVMAEAEEPQLPSIARSCPLKHQGESETTCIYETGGNVNVDVLLSSNTVCSPMSHQPKRRGRGRPRKENVHQSLAAASAEGCNQRILQLDDEDKDTCRLEKCDDTYDIDIQQHSELPGRIRRSLRKVKQEKNSTTETLSLSKCLHQQSPKQNFDEDVLLKDVLSGENEPKPRRRGRPRKVLALE